MMQMLGLNLLGLAARVWVGWPGLMTGQNFFWSYKCIIFKTYENVEDLIDTCQLIWVDGTTFISCLLHPFRHWRCVSEEHGTHRMIEGACLIINPWSYKKLVIGGKCPDITWVVFSVKWWKNWPRISDGVFKYS